MRDLRERDLWRSTILICTGEFGRAAVSKPAEGRDHGPTGFSVWLGGGPIAGGAIIGDTGDGSPEPSDPVTVPDLFATLLTAMGLDPATENLAPGGRPVKLGEGTPVTRLLTPAAIGRRR